jgi:hypothetical protein
MKAGQTTDAGPVVSVRQGHRRSSPSPSPSSSSSSTTTTKLPSSTSLPLASARLRHGPTRQRDIR